ncbi:M56 family metallopeptidase [Thermomonas haemolytica]|uniref:M56 family metallopeptidase n=1 Tax=Thermomonas haemolytica TaxID=141949 RepID=UPI000E0D8FDB|nr:M56 family metallopeptidase [Thermomonas haemolytica]
MRDAFFLLAPALGATLLHFLWQGTLLALLASGALALLRGARAQTRYAIACLALCVALLAPLLTLGWLLASPSLAASAAGADLSPTAPAALSGWPLLPEVTVSGAAVRWPWLVLGWAAGAGLLSLRMAGGLLWIGRLRRRAWTDENGVLQAMADPLALRIGLRNPVFVCLSRDIASPVAAGWWRPMVLVPAALALRMPAPLLEALIAHELAHVRRHDYLVNLLQGVVETLLFYHPVVWWLSRRIREERELIADDLAANALGDRRRLALALAELDRSFDASTPTLPRFAPAARGGQLMARIQHLIRPRRSGIARSQLLSLASLPLLGLALAGIAAYAQATPAQTAPVQASTGLPPPPLHMSTRGPDGNGYSLVRHGTTRTMATWNREDQAALEAARARIDGDFLLVRRGKQHLVLRDPGLLDQVEAVWAPLNALDGQMQALQVQMAPHQQRLHALQVEMDRAQPPAVPAGLNAETSRLATLASRQAELAARQAQIAHRMRKADDSERADLERQRSALAAESDALSAQLREQSARVEAQTRRIRVQSEQMREVGARMEAASAPMQAIGKDMEALGRRIEQAAMAADGKTRKLIDDAVARGLAQPLLR